MTTPDLRAACFHGMYDRHIITKGELLGETCIGGQVVTLTSMYRSGGLSGAWYPEENGDPPDGWLIRRGDIDDDS